MMDLSAQRPKVAEYVETGRTYLDGSMKVGALDGVVRDRIRMALNGHVMVNIILDENDEPLGEPWCEISGLAETGHSRAPLVDVLEEDLSQFMGRAGQKTLTDDDKLEEGLRKIARQTTQTEIGKRPEVTVIISRLCVLNLVPFEQTCTLFVPKSGVPMFGTECTFDAKKAACRVSEIGIATRRRAGL